MPPSPTPCQERASELIDQFALAEWADRLARTYSGGLRRRLDLAASLVAEPPVLVLDEPTTGLDPRTRADVWEAVTRLVAEGTTVLLTTQYLEEADHLADRITVMDRGSIVAEGTADELKAQVGGDVIEVDLTSAEQFGSALEVLSRIRDDRAVDPERQRITLPAHDGIATLRTALDYLDQAGIRLDDIGIRRPSLDDVYLVLTGHGASNNDSESSDPNSHSLRPPGEEAAPITIGTAAIPLEVPRHVMTGTIINDAWVITKRNLRRIRRTPRLLLVSSIQPVLFVLMFRYVFGGSLHIPGMTYIDYLLPGAFVTATLFGVTTAIAMATDLSGGMIDRFRSLPIARSAVLAGRCTADLLRSLLVVMVVLVAGGALGFHFHNGVLGAVGGLGVALAAGFAFIWVLALIGLLAKDAETAHLAGTLFVTPFIFGSSVFVRVDNMPSWLQLFARNQPVSVTVDTVRALCEGGPVAHYGLESATWIVGLVVVCGFSAVSVYRRT